MPPLTVRSLVKQASGANHEANKRILAQAENSIRQQHAVGAEAIWFAVPQWLFGLPVVDAHDAASYVAARLRKSGFEVSCEAPDPLHEPNNLWLRIDWSESTRKVQKAERAKRNRARREARGRDDKVAPAASPGQLLTHLRASLKQSA